jgi:Protein of unknown function (DUF1552)
MIIKPMNRRTVLRGMLATGAAIAVPLPLLESMLNANGTALAQTGASLSPLYVTWFFGNGTLPGRWKPTSTGTGSSWALSPQLEPLSELKSYLTVVTGLEGKLVVSGNEHPTGSAAATTGAPLDGNAVRAASIDQVVADLIADGSPYRSLELGVTPATPNGNPHSLHSVSHSGPNARNDPQFDPRAVFERLFSGATEPTVDASAADQTARLARVRVSVLDAITQDGVDLQRKLGVADRRRLEQHLEAIRSIEGRLGATASGEPQQAACSALTAPDVGPDTKSEAPAAVNSAMVELATLALSCELTRVISFMFSLPAAHVYYRHLAPDMNDDFHDTICHGDAGDQSNQPRVDTGVVYAMRCLSELLKRLAETPHGDSTLLDAGLVYVTSDTAWGKTHTKEEWPVLLAGKARGRLRGDEHHNFPGENLSAALLTVAQLMGSTQMEFGLDAGHVTSALAGIQV